MNRSSSSSFGRNSILSSSSGNPIHAPAPIIPLKAIHDNDNLLVNDILSILTERDVDRLHDHYQISRKIFKVYAPHSNVPVDKQTPAEDTIMIYEEQLKVGLWFPMDPLFIEVF